MTLQKLYSPYRTSMVPTSPYISFSPLETSLLFLPSSFATCTYTPPEKEAAYSFGYQKTKQLKNRKPQVLWAKVIGFRGNGFQVRQVEG